MKRLLETRNSHTILDLQRYVPALVTFLENRLTNTASVIYRETLGIGATEMRIIILLGTRSSVSGNEIGQAIGLDKAAVSRALKSLEAQRLVDVTAGFGRRRDVTLTASGRKVHDKGVAISLRREERLLAGFTQAERKSLVEFLNRMIAQMPGVSAVSAEFAVLKSRPKKRGSRPA